MNINRTNYESWFLDYHEGTLSPEEAAALFAFLDKHPDLREEFEGFEMIHLDADADLTHMDKEALRKTVNIDEQHLDEWLIAELEGQLSEEELMQLHDYLHQHPEKKNDRRVFAATVLESGTEMHPSGKLLYASEPIGAHNIDLWLIAETEGQLHLQQKTQLQNFLNAHPEYHHHRDLYAATLLHTAAPEIFERKDALYKKDTPVLRMPAAHSGAASHTPYRSLLRIAAVLLMLIGGGYVLRLFLQPGEKQQYLAQQPASPQTTENPVSPGQNDVMWPAEPDSITNGTGIPKDTISVSPATAPALQKVAPVRRNDRRRKPLRQAAPIVPEIMPQQLARLTPKGSPVLETPEPFVFAERRYTPKATPHYNDGAATPSLRNAIEQDPLASTLLTPRVLQAEMGMNEEVIMAEQPSGKLTLGSRILQAGARVVGRMTGEKVKVRTAFNPITGKLSAYEVETKKRTWQKQLKADYVSAE